MNGYVQIAVDVPIFSALTYRVPDSLQGIVEVGQLVQVPFRNRAKTGLVVGMVDQAPTDFKGKIRDVLDVVDRQPLLGEAGLKFLHFIADYYFTPLGEVVRLAIPAAIRIEGIKHYQRRVEAAPSEALEPQLLAALEKCAETPVSVHKLKEEFGQTFLQLGELERLGLVEVTYTDDTDVAAKTEVFARLLEVPDGKKLGKRQAELVQALRSVDTIAWSELRETTGAPLSALRALAESGIADMWEQEVYRDPFTNIVAKEPIAEPLTPAQFEVAAALAQALESGTFKGVLLHGVTGSGKTRVYVDVIQRALANNQTALVLLPEIALTPQFVSVFRGYFGDDVAVLHSGLTAGQRFDQWRKIQRGEVRIVVGARSAIFAPIADLGVIVVDEEHDPSFKQEDGPRYNARDLALMRGKLESALVILGSATPSLETYQHAIEGRLELLKLPKRVLDRPLPSVEIVDMRRREDLVAHVLSPELVDSMAAGFRQDRQTIVFLNRRGFSPCVICDECGHRFKCPHCDVSLTYHRRKEALRCHHCDFSLRLPEVCPECAAQGIGPHGVGTEQLEEILQNEFPEIKVSRLDRDTGNGAGLQRILNQFAAGQADVLVGTQMVTKGHDFPGVTTVGVVAADQSLNFPDFRSAERTFQLLTQVAGRAGRGDDPGHVYIQSYIPDHYSLVCALRHDYLDFAERELALRKIMKYPPFTHVIAIKFEAASDGAVIQAAGDYSGSARRRVRHERGFEQVVMVGPALAPIERLRGKTRYQLMFRAEDRSLVRRLVHWVLHDQGYFEPGGRHTGVRIHVDVDPQNLL
jgi:primosomal protein N' (replication factor Y)